MNDDIGEVVYNQNDRDRSDLVGKSFLTKLLIRDDLFGAQGTCDLKDICHHLKYNHTAITLQW